MADLFKTVTDLAQGLYKEKMSKFISFVEPVSSADEAKTVIKRYSNQYHDARHVCWAYMIGTHRDVFLSSDTGEPSGTAGKPILGQINSFGLTNVVIVVVRYFGGIKLGTSGLISAYREAARLAIEAATIIECHEQAAISFTFPYLALNNVMRLAKGNDVRILEQLFDNTCFMTLQCDADFLPTLRTKIQDIDGTSLIDD